MSSTYGPRVTKKMSTHQPSPYFVASAGYAVSTYVALPMIAQTNP